MWEKHEVDLLGVLIKDGLTNSEISNIIGKPAPAISLKARREFGGNLNYKKRITKHAHLREEVLRFYKNHSKEETMKKFGFTQSEFKSCMTYAYKEKKLFGIRKDKRRKDPWSSGEFRLCLQHCGLVSREQIAKKMKRGGVEAIRGKLDKLGLASKSVNGITLSQFREAFGKDPDFYLETKAGPSTTKYSSFWKIIPWVYLDQEIKNNRLKTSEVFEKVVSAMALFQEWVYGRNAIKKMIKICKES